jgi:hypothetical protein
MGMLRRPVRQGVAHAREVGNRYWDWLLLGFVYPFYTLGAWDDVLAMRDELPREDWTQARLAHGTPSAGLFPYASTGAGSTRRNA